MRNIPNLLLATVVDYFAFDRVVSYRSRILLISTFNKTSQEMASRGHKVFVGSRRMIVFSNFAGQEQRRALNLGVNGMRIEGKGNFHQRVEGEKASVFKPRVINDASQLVAARGS